MPSYPGAVNEETTPDVDDLPEQMRVRREKRERMLAAGVSPYPVEVPRTHSLAEVRAAHSELAADAQTGEKV